MYVSFSIPNYFDFYFLDFFESRLKFYNESKTIVN